MTKDRELNDLYAQVVDLKADRVRLQARIEALEKAGQAFVAQAQGRRFSGEPPLGLGVSSIDTAFNDLAAALAAEEKP